MTIRIAGRIHPFSHLPGTLFLLPQTHIKLQVFPARINFFQYADATPLFWLSLDIQGPMKEFTVEMDLEHQHIKVFGTTAKGHLRYIMHRRADGIGIIMERLPQATLTCYLSFHNKTYQMLRGETLLISKPLMEPPPLHFERLSLGMHKAQDWDLMKRRCDLKEIFPLLLRLGQITPPSLNALPLKANMILLQKCEKIVRKNLRQEIIPAFIQLLLASFEGVCVPRLWDTDYQGIAPFETSEENDLSSIFILTQAAVLIRSLFLKEEGDTLSLLPCLPPDFHSGRIVQAQTLFGDLIDFEWTKKQMHRVILYSHSKRTLHLKLSKYIRTCRVRWAFKDKGKKLPLKEGVLPLNIDQEQRIWIDRFQK